MSSDRRSREGMGSMKFRTRVVIAMLLLSLPVQAQEPSVCPDDFGAFAETTDPLVCTCSAEAAGRGSVWGMDIYTADSSICRAALHAGVVPRQGGAVTVIPEAGRNAYPGVTRNGVSSSNYGGYRSRFRFAPKASTAAPVPAAAAPMAPAADAAASVCPDDFAAYAGTREPVSCTCPADATGRGAIWGMDVYTGDSSVCQAALHAGVVGRQGGAITVIPEAGRNAYPGVTRNGVRSSNFGRYESSFRFGPTSATGAAAQAPVTPMAGSTASICPDDFDAYAGTSDPVPCTCPADATERGAVWGTDVYTGDSSVCRAALHAGAVGRQGGAVTVLPEAGRNAYPGVTRNGVRSSNFGQYGSSFHFAARAAASAATPVPPTAAAPASPAPVGVAPVQQPIAATIQARGQVELYIQFKFNSADLEMNSAETLFELRNVLRGDPSLRLMLVGHTDSVGTPAYNLTLSHRRAQSVMNWLRSQGIDAGRLAIDGKGQEQPIADNGTDAGRALNRRVQAIRVR